MIGSEFGQASASPIKSAASPSFPKHRQFLAQESAPKNFRILESVDQNTDTIPAPPANGTRNARNSIVWEKAFWNTYQGPLLTEEPLSAEEGFLDKSTFEETNILTTTEDKYENDLVDAGALMSPVLNTSEKVMDQNFQRGVRKSYMRRSMAWDPAFQQEGLLDNDNFFDLTAAMSPAADASGSEAFMDDMEKLENMKSIRGLENNSGTENLMEINVSSAKLHPNDEIKSQTNSQTNGRLKHDSLTHEHADTNANQPVKGAKENIIIRGVETSKIKPPSTIPDRTTASRIPTMKNVSSIPTLIPSKNSSTNSSDQASKDLTKQPNAVTSNKSNIPSFTNSKAGIKSNKQISQKGQINQNTLSKPGNSQLPNPHQNFYSKTSSGSSSEVPKISNLPSKIPSKLQPKTNTVVSTKVKLAETAPVKQKIDTETKIKKLPEKEPETKTSMGTRMIKKPGTNQIASLKNKTETSKPELKGETKKDVQPTRSTAKLVASQPHSRIKTGAADSIRSKPGPVSNHLLSTVSSSLKQESKVKTKSSASAQDLKDVEPNKDTSPKLTARTVRNKKDLKPTVGSHEEVGKSDTSSNLLKSPSLIPSPKLSPHSFSSPVKSQSSLPEFSTSQDPIKSTPHKGLNPHPISLFPQVSKSFDSPLQKASKIPSLLPNISSPSMRRDTRPLSSSMPDMHSFLDSKQRVQDHTTKMDQEKQSSVLSTPSHSIPTLPSLKNFSRPKNDVRRSPPLFGKSIPSLSAFQLREDALLSSSQNSSVAPITKDALPSLKTNSNLEFESSLFPFSPPSRDYNHPFHDPTTQSDESIVDGKDKEEKVVESFEKVVSAPLVESANENAEPRVSSAFMEHAVDEPPTEYVDIDEKRIREESATKSGVEGEKTLNLDEATNTDEVREEKTGGDSSENIINHGENILISSVSDNSELFDLHESRNSDFMGEAPSEEVAITQDLFSNHPIVSDDRGADEREEITDLPEFSDNDRESEGEKREEIENERSKFLSIQGENGLEEDASVERGMVSTQTTSLISTPLDSASSPLRKFEAAEQVDVEEEFELLQSQFIANLKSDEEFSQGKESKQVNDIMIGEMTGVEDQRSHDEIPVTGVEFKGEKSDDLESIQTQNLEVHISDNLVLPEEAKAETSPKINTLVESTAFESSTTPEVFASTKALTEVSEELGTSTLSESPYPPSTLSTSFPSLPGSPGEDASYHSSNIVEHNETRAECDDAGVDPDVSQTDLKETNNVTDFEETRDEFSGELDETAAKAIIFSVFGVPATDELPTAQGPISDSKSTSDSNFKSNAIDPSELEISRDSVSTIETTNLEKVDEDDDDDDDSAQFAYHVNDRSHIMSKTLIMDYVDPSMSLHLDKNPVANEKGKQDKKEEEEDDSDSSSEIFSESYSDPSFLMEQEGSEKPRTRSTLGAVDPSTYPLVEDENETESQSDQVIHTHDPLNTVNQIEEEKVDKMDVATDDITSRDDEFFPSQDLNSDGKTDEPSEEKEPFHHLAYSSVIDPDVAFYLYKDADLDDDSRGWPLMNDEVYQKVVEAERKKFYSNRERLVTTGEGEGDGADDEKTREIEDESIQKQESSDELRRIHPSDNSELYIEWERRVMLAEEQGIEALSKKSNLVSNSPVLASKPSESSESTSLWSPVITALFFTSFFMFPTFCTNIINHDSGVVTAFILRLMIYG